MNPSPRFKRLIWMFPILYFIHDLEEIMTIEKFITKHSDLIPLKVSTTQFTIAFTLLWLVTLIGCFRASKGQSFLGLNPTTFFAFLIPGIFLANGIGHLMQFIFLGDYVPGVFTSIFIIFPYSYITLRFLLIEKMVTTKKFLLYLILGFVLQGPFALTALFLGKLISN